MNTDSSLECTRDTYIFASLLIKDGGVFLLCCGCLGHCLSHPTSRSNLCSKLLVEHPGRNWDR